MPTLERKGRRVKIVFINRFFYPDHSATSQMLTDLVFGLADDFAIEVITSRQRYDDPQARLARQENIQGVQVTRIWTSNFGRDRLIGRALDYLSFYFSAFFALLGAVNKGDIVVAKTDPPMISIVAGWVCRLKDATLVNWLQDLFPEVAQAAGIKLFQGPAFKLIRAIRDRSLKLAAKNIVLGQVMFDKVIKRGLPATQIQILPNWADEAEIRPIAPTDNVLRTQWGLADAFVVGYSGNLGRAHDVATLKTALVDLAEVPNVRFLFIGGGAGMDELKAWVEAQQLSHILFKSYQDRAILAQSLSVADVHLVTLLPEMEGLIVPSKLYGLLGVARPVIFIGSAEGEIGRLLRENRLGLTVAVGDAEGLKQAILSVQADRLLLDEMSERGRALFLADYAKSSVIKKWHALFTQLA